MIVSRDKESEVMKMKYMAIGCDVYKVSADGNTWTLYKRFKTEKGAQTWVARH